jgi:beta-glucosidase
VRRDDTPFDQAVGQVRSGRPADEEARRLLRDCTESEKLGLLDGDEPFWPGMPTMIGVGYNLEPIVAGAVPRLGIPGIRFSDGPRGVCINLLRHPAWGRAQETYGEEPVLLGSMGVALARGAQRHVMACVKHYACNSMENARFSVDVGASAADPGAVSVMVELPEGGVR